jgi:hypothetical protein
MADLYANLDGHISKGPTAWVSVRDGTSGTADSSLNKNENGVSVYAVAAGRGTNYSVTRTFMHFDTSGISGNVSMAKLFVRGFSSNNGSVIAVKSDAFGGDGGTALAGADYDNIVGFSAGASLAGNATTYSSNGPFLTTGWSVAAYNNMGATSDLKSDMQNNDSVIVCLMDYTNDYLNTPPGSTGTFSSGIVYSEMTGTGNDPYIQYTEDASGYTHDVMGVAASSVGKVLGVATANIGEIIGV